mgnify:CR=1 FL=1
MELNHPLTAEPTARKGEAMTPPAFWRKPVWELSAEATHRSTATTVTVVDADRRYRGGVILAGVKLSLHALFSGTAQLPDIALEAPGKVICSVTEDSLQAGAIYGAAAMADGLLDRMEEELGAPCTAVATGGLAGVITPYCRRDIRRDDSLLLRGLALIWRKNRGNR